jgi:hypothetical protein
VDKMPQNERQENAGQKEEEVPLTFSWVRIDWLISDWCILVIIIVMWMLNGGYSIDSIQIADFRSILWRCEKLNSS